MADKTEGRPSPEAEKSKLEEGQLSTNFFWKIPIGEEGKYVFDMQTTIRNVPDFPQLIEHFKVVRRSLESIIQAGGFPKPVGSSAYERQSKGEPLPAPAIPPVSPVDTTTFPGPVETSVSMALPPMPSEPEYIPDEQLQATGLQVPLPLQAAPNKPMVPGVGAYDGMFNAEFLAVTEQEGKKYFRVKGSPYHKYGVKVWPEVLRAIHIDPDSLTATTQTGYDLVGYTAYYINQKEADPKTGKIYPEKVIALVKMQ